MLNAQVIKSPTFRLQSKRRGQLQVVNQYSGSKPMPTELPEPNPIEKILFTQQEVIEQDDPLPEPENDFWEDRKFDWLGKTMNRMPILVGIVFAISAIQGGISFYNAPLPVENIRDSIIQTRL